MLAGSTVNGAGPPVVDATLASAREPNNNLVGTNNTTLLLLYHAHIPPKNPLVSDGLLPLPVVNRREAVPHMTSAV